MNGLARLGLGLVLTAGLAGCCYTPGYYDPHTGCMFGGGLEPACHCDIFKVLGFCCWDPGVCGPYGCNPNPCPPGGCGPCGCTPGWGPAVGVNQHVTPRILPSGPDHQYVPPPEPLPQSAPMPMETTMMHYGSVMSHPGEMPPTMTSAPQQIMAAPSAPVHHQTISAPRLPNLSSPQAPRQTVSHPQQMTPSQSVTVPAGLYSAPPVVRPVPTVPTQDARNQRWTPSRL